MPKYEINQYRGVYKRAIELYEDEKFKEAGLLLEKVCENDQSNYMACYYYADLLYYGKGMPKDPKKAFQYYMIAATNKVTPIKIQFKLFHGLQRLQNMLTH